MKITDLARTAGGHWRATLTIDGDAVEVDRCLGSWQIPLEGGGRRDVLPHVARELQEHVRRMERREVRDAAAPC